MMESLSVKINKLGLLENAGEITLNQLMIFSGESGLGKSYLAILSHYFFDILLDRKRISRFFVERGYDYDEMRPGFKNEGEALTFSKKDFEKWLAKDALHYLGYMINNDGLEGDIEVSLPDNVEERLTIYYSKEIAGLINNEDSYIRLTMGALSTMTKDSGFHEESPYAFIFRFYLIRALLGDHLALNQTFVFPPSRGPMLTEDILPITGMFYEFKDGLNRLKGTPREKEDINIASLKLFSEILEGTVKQKDGNFFYVVKDVELPISAAAASVRELAPIEQMVRKVVLGKTAILIEEPEAHLHPLKQRMMADITSSLMHAGASMQITTHSDYYLRRLNELMLLNKLSAREDYESIAKSLKIIPELAIDKKNVSAYLLRRNENGAVKIENQDVDCGIPFTSFHDALKDSLNTIAKLNNLIDCDEGN